MTLSESIVAFAAEKGVPIEDFLDPQLRRFGDLRSECAVMLRSRPECPSFPEIAKAMHWRSHSAAIDAVRRAGKPTKRPYVRRVLKPPPPPPPKPRPMSLSARFPPPEQRFVLVPRPTRE